jgi:hypothetical protein
MTTRTTPATPQMIRSVTGANIATCAKALKIGGGDTRRALMWLYHHDRAMSEPMDGWETCAICAQDADRALAWLQGDER